MNTKEFKTQIDSAARILIVLPYTLNSDACATAGLLNRLLKVKLNKEVDFASSKRVPARFVELLKKAAIDTDKILSDIKPVSYVIKVGDAKEAINVEWKKVDDRIDLVLTPQTQEIDFSKVSFAKEGGIYDLVIAINSPSLNDLGKIYSDHKNIFDKFAIVSVDSLPEEDYAKASLIDDNYTTTSEVVFKAFEELDYSPEKLDAEIAAEGIIGSTFGLHQITKNKSFGVIAELANKYEVDLAAITTKYFYSFTKDDIKLRERILRNVRFDDSRKTVYSILTSQDFAQLNLTPKALDGEDYLLFNICKGYDYAFLVYEENGKSFALIHSNRLNDNFEKILDTVNGMGSKLFGSAAFDLNANDSANKILAAISGNATPSSEEKAPEVPVTSAPVETQDTLRQAQGDNAVVTPTEIIQPTKAQVNNVEEIPQTSNQPTQPVATPVVQNQAAPTSPFTPATSFAVDEKAEPAKKANYYSANDKPFDKVTY